MLLQRAGVVGGISYSEVLADIGGTQRRAKLDMASGALVWEGFIGDADYDVPRTGDSTASVGTCYRQTSGAPVWDPYGNRLGAAIGGLTRNRYSGTPADIIADIKAMTEGFINVWIKPGTSTNDGAFFSFSENASLAPYCMLRRSGVDTVQLYVSSSPANQYRIGAASLTFGVPMMVTFINDSGVWRMRVNGANPGASTVADGVGSGAYWMHTISTADTISFGYLQRGGINNACDNDLLYDFVIGDTPPTDQQIADLYAATLP